MFVNRGIRVALCRGARGSRSATRMAPLPEAEYTATPEYPDLPPLKPKFNWPYEIRDLPTIEQKIFKMNMPRYYGWKCTMLHERPYMQSLPFLRMVTRTHMMEGADSLPDAYMPYESAATYLAQQLKSEVEDVLLLEWCSLRNELKFKPGANVEAETQKYMTKKIVKQLNRILMNHLSPNAPHLIESQVDIEPRHEAFWFHGGMYKKAKFTYLDSLKDQNHKFTNKPLQFIGEPILAIRNSLPLEPIMPHEDASNASWEIPSLVYDPCAFGYTSEKRHGTLIPGFWPGELAEFGQLTYHWDNCILRKDYDENDKLEKKHGQALLISFSWLLAQAAYQGFTTFNDITYPFVTQTVITDGQYFSFYVYQLNTTEFHMNVLAENNKKNVCYWTKPMKLFETVDSVNKVIGFNEQVLKMLIQFYLNTPKEREGVVMKPYLSEDVKVIADIAEDEKRIWLEQRYKHMVSNRVRHKTPYEIYQWEHIYKIKFQTRPMDARKRPFECFQKNPLLKPMDEHHPAYIPKVFREGGKKNRKGKFAKTYYP